MDASNNTSINSTGCLPLASVVLTIISSVASVIGSLLIIGTFVCWKDLRTIARMILVFLAIADLFTAIGYIFGAIIYIRYYLATGFCSSPSYSYEEDPIHNSTYNKLCQAQSFFTTLFPIASFIWTGNLAIYLFLSVSLRRFQFAKSFMILSHITSWGIPLVTCVFVAGFGLLGPSGSQASGGWCWIALNIKNKSEEDVAVQYKNYFITELFAGKIWEISVCVLSVFLYVAIKVILWRRKKQTKDITESAEYSSSSALERQLQAAYTKLDQKLMWLPIVFLLLRVWGNVRFFLSIDCYLKNGGYVSCHNRYNLGLVYLQSICDPGQGWSNALLFVIFHRKISQRICPCFYSAGEWCCRVGSQVMTSSIQKHKKRNRNRKIKVVKTKAKKLETSVSSRTSGAGAKTTATPTPEKIENGDRIDIYDSRNGNGEGGFGDGSGGFGDSLGTTTSEREPLLNDSIASSNSVLYTTNTRASSAPSVRYHYGNGVPDTASINSKF